MKSPCENCPRRMPMDTETWKKVKKAQREATPNLSRGQCAKLTSIERKEFEGLEAGVKDCGGYSRVKGAAKYLVSRLSGGYLDKKTEAGGSRSVSWREAACNNPWLESPEHFALEDQFQAVGSDGSEDSLGPFKTEEQREAFLAGNTAVSKMMLWMATVAGGAAIAEASPQPIEAVGAGIAGLGLYKAIGSGVDMARATVTEFRESRGE